MEKLKELRDKTGAGMVDCKKALEEAGGDLEKAVEILRKKGIAKAAKRTDRETNEGVVKMFVNSDKSEGYIIELNSETDFVSRNEKFQGLADEILKVAASNKIIDREALLNSDMGGKTVKEEIDVLSGVIGEKLDLKRAKRLVGKTVVSYSHAGGRLGVLLSLDKEGMEDLGYDLAMHVAAANPKYISSEQVLPEEITKEKEIYTEQLKKEGKPEAMIEKILEGKMNKYYEEVCLLNQEYIKDDSKKVKDVLGDVKVLSFVIFSLTGSSVVCSL